METSTSSSASASNEEKLHLKLTTRSKTGVQTYMLFGAKELTPDDKLSDPAATLFQYNKDGSLLALISKTHINIVDTESGNSVHKIDQPNVTAFCFSPGNKYFMTYTRYTPENTENLIIWDIKSGQPISKLAQRQSAEDNWPPIQWSDDDSVAAKLFANEVQFYPGDQVTASAPASKIQLPNVASFALSPGKDFSVAVFVPEKKGVPGSVKLYRYPSLEVVISKSFFRATEANFSWNSSGTAVLVQTHTDVDKSGKSYYGESGLYCLSTDKTLETDVRLTKEGPVHCSCWAPIAKEFLAIYGFMPSQATIFNGKCEPLVDFGEAARNSAKWSPSGKLLCIAGFGNLQGTMDFWERKNNKIKKLNNVAAPYTSHYEWSPDSSYLLTAVLHPRMRLDNEFKIWSYDGTLIHHQPVKDELYQVTFKPVPRHLLSKLAPPIKVAATTTAEPAKESPKPTGKYIPPHATGSSFMKREVQGPTVYKKDTGASNAPPKPIKKDLPPGYDDDEPKKPKKKPASKPNPTPAPAPAPKPTPVQEPTEADPQKKLKMLSKKLRQIEDLKQQQASGKTLTKEQLDKVAGEASLRKEMEALSI